MPARLRRWGSLVLALIVAAVGLTAGAGPAGAATVYEIEGEWEADTPGTVAKGDVVTSVWRVNVNDDRPAPSNDPVENVTFTVTLDHGLFKVLPDLCLTRRVDPASSISADGRTLTCNLGTVKQGTAVVVQAPVVADGITGDQITARGEIAGQQVGLDPINIRNTFGMDMLWGTPTDTRVNKDNDAIAFDFEWTLFQDVGSDAGPDTIVYNINIPLQNGMPLHLSEQANFEPFNQPCTPFQNSRSAEGHPYSRGGTTANRAPFVDSCVLTQTGPNSFRMTLTGIDYSLTQVPTEDSAGNPLPTDRVAVASGSIWLEVRGLTEATSANLSASAPTYRSVTGQTDPDETNNNTSSKVITFPGTWSHAWIRTGGGTPWDNTFKVSPGTLVTDRTTDTIAVTGVPDTTVMGDCSVLDAAYVDYDSVRLFAWTPGDPIGEPEELLGGTLAWYVGNDPTVTPGSSGYNPDAFTGCASNVGWVFVEPVDKTTVKAVRWTGTAGLLNQQNFAMQVSSYIQQDAPIGRDVWTWGSVVRNGEWVHPGREGSGAIYTPTPDDEYSGTNGARDILHVIFAVPAVAKRGDRQVVRPGEPASFTLTYSANGSGTVPPTVDGYQIVDTLPVGMTYVGGSASPEPVVTTDGQGRQVLTWNLDDVPTNTRHTLVYQAVADDSVTPGQTLTNTVTSSLRGETSRPATAQVTVSASGYTEISKVADTPFIPNLTGEGDGEGAWTVTLRSFDPLPQAFTDTIDILPWEGDRRGTDYEGSYALVAVEALNGQTVYYTDADPATLSDDPAAAANGAANAPSAMWSRTRPARPTAIRVIGPTLAPGAAQAFRVRIATDGADGEDVYVNRAQARAEHTRLVMRTSEPMAVANYYSAALKKYVQDVDGVWRDAQDVTDYPTFKYGETVRYRIVVTNTGQGTLRNIDVTDDKQPTLGSFRIDSLASGQSRSHEFEFVLNESTDGTVVNTACGKADIPADSQVPPTINCDPAGFKVANYVTTKVADPATGSAVKSGEVISYTIAVTQQGTAPAEAVWTDDLADVLDDARYNGDVIASMGTVEYVNGSLVWKGTVPVGQVALVTYSVTVRGVNQLGNRDLVNPVTSPGCVRRDGETIGCDTEHPVPKFDLKLEKKVLGGDQVLAGGKVRYRLKVSSVGPDLAPAAIRLVDKLPRGLQLKSARGKGWDCSRDKKRDKVRCELDRALEPGKKAPRVLVVAKATKAAVGRRLVNTAAVECQGETRCANNPDVAGVSVVRVPPSPATGFRAMPPWLM